MTEERILNISRLLHIWKESKSVLLLHRAKLKCEPCDAVTRPGRNKIELRKQYEVKYVIKISDEMGTEEEKCRYRRSKKNNCCLLDRIEGFCVMA